MNEFCELKPRLFIDDVTKLAQVQLSSLYQINRLFRILIPTRDTICLCVTSVHIVIYQIIQLLLSTVISRYIELKIYITIYTDYSGIHARRFIAAK